MVHSTYPFWTHFPTPFWTPFGPFSVGLQIPDLPESRENHLFGVSTYHPRITPFYGDYVVSFIPRYLPPRYTTSCIPFGPCLDPLDHQISGDFLRAQPPISVVTIKYLGPKYLNITRKWLLLSITRARRKIYRAGDLGIWTLQGLGPRGLQPTLQYPHTTKTQEVCVHSNGVCTYSVWLHLGWPYTSTQPQ